MIKVLLFYCITTWQTCRKTKAWLSENNVNYSFRNISKDPPSGEELQKLAQIGNFTTLKELVNTKGQTYKKLKPNLESLSEEEVVHLIKKNPSLLVRPILTDGHNMIVGFKEANYQAFLKIHQ